MHNPSPSAPLSWPELPDEAIAARIAGLVPEGEAAGPVVTTRVVVTGLISVASIAGFKRNRRPPSCRCRGVTEGSRGRCRRPRSNG